MAKHIYVVDDEPDIVELVLVHLKKAGFEASGFADGRALFSALRKQAPELVILDLMLPDTDGFDICKQLKSDERFRGIPVIMLTAKTHETDKVLGLELGADDYVTKPFSPRELVARVKAVLRRRAGQDERHPIETDGLVIDPGQHTVSYKGSPVELTATEFGILQLLAEKPGSVVTRQKLLQHICGDTKIVLDRTIDVHMANLRQKLGPGRALIKNIRGLGYKLTRKQ